MTDLFGEPAPIRAVVHLNLWASRTRLDWDLIVQNASTGDILRMEAHPNIPAHKLGPELSRMLLVILDSFGEGSAADEAE